MRRKRNVFVLSTTLTVALLSAIVLAFVSGSARGITGPRFFDTDCNFVKSGYFDPLLNPGVEPGSHLHNFFGNKSINKNSTGASLEAFNSTRFNSTGTSCRIEDDSEPGNKRKDGAAYWTPALSYCQDNGDCDDLALEPISMHVYYRAILDCDDPCTDPSDPHFTHTPPVGFAFIAGEEQVVNFAGETIQTGRVGEIDWFCTGGFEQRFRTAQKLLEHDYAGDQICPNDHKLAVTIHGPSCWDGVTLFPGPEEPNSHVSEPPCPENWVRIPRLNMQVFWEDEDIVINENFKFRMNYHYQCGVGCEDQWDSTEFAHFDFLNAWDTTDPDADGRAMLLRMVTGCLNSRSLDHRYDDPPGDNDCNE